MARISEEAAGFTWFVAECVEAGRVLSHPAERHCSQVRSTSSPAVAMFRAFDSRMGVGHYTVEFS